MLRKQTKNRCLDKRNWESIEYVDNLTFMMDVKVIIGTIKTVLSKADAELSKSGIENELEELKAQWKDKSKKSTKKIKEKAVEV